MMLLELLSAQSFEQLPSRVAPPRCRVNMAAHDVRVPAAIAEARKLLSEAGKDINADNLKEVLTPTMLNKCASAMRTAMKNKASSETVEQYKLASSDKKRREWLASFVLDPDVSKCFGSHVTTVQNKTSEQGRRLWLTIKQLSSPMFFNCEEHALAMAEGAPERPSQYPQLANKGVKEYQIEVTEEQWKKVRKEEVSISASSDMSAEDYKKVKAAMDSDSAPPAKKKKAGSPKDPEQMTPEERARHEAQAAKKTVLTAFNAAQKGAKQLAEKIRKEVDQAIHSTKNGRAWVSERDAAMVFR